MVNNVVVDGEAEIIDGYQGGSSIAVWSIEDVNTNLITLQTRTYTTSYETRIDEKRAMQIGWSEKELGPAVASCLGSQILVEPEHPSVQKLVQHWTNGDPKKAKPYMLAKYLAAKVMEHVNVQGSVLGQVPEEWRRSVRSDIWGTQGFWMPRAPMRLRHRPSTCGRCLVRLVSRLAPK